MSHNFPMKIGPFENLILNYFLLTSQIGNFDCFKCMKD